MTGLEVYGRIVSGSTVRRDILGGLQMWLPGYLAEVGEQHDRTRDALPPVRSWHSAPDFDTSPEDQLPAVMVVAPGLADVPHRGGDGRYTTEWQVLIGVVVKGRTREESLDLADQYTAAIRACIIQHPGAHGADGISWDDEAFDHIPSDKVRTLAAGSVTFTVTRADTVSAYGGLVTPPDDPTADPSAWPMITDVTAQTTVVDET